MLALKTSSYSTVHSFNALITLWTYKDIVLSFCEKMKASLCLEKRFKITSTPSPLKCETIVFILNWDPKDCTLKDIEDILSISLEKNVDIPYIQRGNSIIVICYFPLSLTSLLIARAQETLEMMKEKGLLQLMSSIRQQLLHVLLIDI